MLSIIFVFIFYWSVTAQIIFYGTFEGEEYFPTTRQSYWSGVVFLTTESYPFNMFFAYENNWYSTLFFLLFIFFAIMFLLNMLVAIVFDNYKKRVAEMQ